MEEIRGNKNKKNATLKESVCVSRCFCCAARYVFNLFLKPSCVCTLLISYGISFHNLLNEYDIERLCITCWNKQVIIGDRSCIAGMLVIWFLK